MDQTTRKPSEVLQLILDKGLYKPEKPGTFMCCKVNDAYWSYGIVSGKELEQTKEAIKDAIEHEHLLDDYLTHHLDVNYKTIANYPFIKTLFYKGLITRLKAQGK